MENFQRIGSVSNTHVGRDFESAAISALAQMGIHVEKNYAVSIGVAEVRKSHQFDLGSESPPTLVECKSHRWTTGGNMPSAKMTVWNEAMYYFACAPEHFRKVLFVLRDIRPKTGESLSQYYIRTYRHLIPPKVEIWEFDEKTGKAAVVHGPQPLQQPDAS